MATSAMTVLDWSVIGVMALSMLLAFVRGFTRELIALLAWVLGFFAARRVLAAGRRLAARIRRPVPWSAISSRSSRS